MGKKKTSIIRKVKSREDVIKRMKAFARENEDNGLCNVTLNFDFPYSFFAKQEIIKIARSLGTLSENIGIADDFCRVPIRFTIGSGKPMWTTGT